jgi:squalene-associated FAD-dependent desaturase
VLLRCFDELLDFYRRCGVEHKVRFYDRLYFVRPGGVVDTLKRDPLPAPFHLTRSLLAMSALDWADKWSIVRCLRAIPKERRRRSDLDEITMGDWLRAKNATPRAIERFWRPILVSALNEEPDRSSALPAFQVFDEGMLGSRTSYEIGIPVVPLAELYSAAIEQRLGPGVNIHLRSGVESIDAGSDEADYFISAVPFERVAALLPDFPMDLKSFEHSPITGIHLWFDRPITNLDHAILLDRQLQWIFRKSDTYYLAVVSASRDMVNMSKSEIVELALRELAEFFPKSSGAVLQRSHVVKEIRATYSAKPGLESKRPSTRTCYPNVFLAGDWTNTGWPATMEGAVRSGYAAADAIIDAARSAK